MMMKKIKLKGFTLIEILVVLMILGLLTAVIAINVLPSQERAREDKAKADIRLLEQALELYRLDMISYPNSREGLQALVTVPEPEAIMGVPIGAAKSVPLCILL